MKRLALALAVVAAAAMSVTVFQRVGQDRRFRALLAEGEVELRDGRSQMAVEAFSGALALRPDAMVALYRRGEAYRQQGQNDRAIRDLLGATRLAPNAPQPLIALGDLLDGAGRPAEAAEWYSRAAALLGDGDPNLLYSLALARYRAGLPGAAQDPLRRAIAQNNGLAEAHYLLGLVSRDAGDTVEAISSLEQATRLAPSLTGAREELADLYREGGRTIDEMRQLEALAALDPDVDRRVTLALAEARSGRFDSALDQLSTVAAAGPGDSRVYMAIGRTYLARAERRGDRASVPLALAALERALGGTARRSEGLALYGRALFLSGDARGAERILREATLTSPVDPEAFAFLADAAERLSHWTVGRDALLKLDALEGNVASPRTRATRAGRIGAFYFHAGDPANAARFLERAIEDVPEDAPLLGLLARARWQLHDADGARQALGRALALDERNASLRRLERTWR